MALFGKKQELSGKSQKASVVPQKPGSSKPAPPQKPKTLFEEKKEWHRREIKEKIVKASPYIPGAGGTMYSRQERKKMIDEIFPEQRFKSHISETEAKKRLREIRREEYRATTSAEKLKFSRLRRYLDEQTGLKGKY